MSNVVGIDGCRGGWFLVQKDLAREILVFRVINKLSDIFSFARQPGIIAIDVPIGLPDEAIPGGRECDRLGRKLLGIRRSSIFSPPVRMALDSASWNEASVMNAQSSSHGIKLTRQCYGIFPKLREIDSIITPALQSMIKEVHPELCFYELNGRKPMLNDKKSRAGAAERRKLLLAAGFCDLDEPLTKYPRSILAEDDVLDACIACWTAQRVFNGEAIRTPEHPILDRKGLRMEMVR